VDKFDKKTGATTRHCPNENCKYHRAVA